MAENFEHHRLEEMISAYIDNELSPQEQTEVESHLTTCADCAWHLRTLRQTVAMVKELPTVPVPRSFTIREARPGGFWPGLRFPRLHLYLKGATALVALLLILMVAGEVVWWGVSLSRPPAAFPVAVGRQQEAPSSPSIEGEQALPAPPSPGEEEAQDEMAAEPGVESAPRPDATVPTPGYEPEKEETAPALSAEAQEEVQEMEKDAPAQEPEEPAAAIEISPPPAAASRPAPSLTTTSPPVPTPTAAVLSPTPAPSPPISTPTIVAQVRSPTSPPEEARTTESARPQPASAWWTPWRRAELTLLALLIILIAMTVLVGHYRKVS